MKATRRSPSNPAPPEWACNKCGWRKRKARGRNCYQCVSPSRFPKPEPEPTWVGILLDDITVEAHWADDHTPPEWVELKAGTEITVVAHGEYHEGQRCQTKCVELANGSRALIRQDFITRKESA